MSGFPNRRFWRVLAIAFLVLAVLFVLKAMWLPAIAAVAAAVWTGLESAGRGALPEQDAPSP